MKLKKLDDTKLRAARKEGFRRKKPKKPNMAKSSVATLENWIRRYNEYVSLVESKAKEYIQREKLIAEIRKAG